MGVVYLLNGTERQLLQMQMQILLTDLATNKPAIVYVIETTSAGTYQLHNVPVGTYHLTLLLPAKYASPPPVEITVVAATTIQLEHTLLQQDAHTNYLPLILR
jgi:hypothetical protein